MQALCFPIDTSLSFVQANKLVRDLKPSNLVLPRQHTVPPLLQPHRSDLVIEAVCVAGLGSAFLSAPSWLLLIISVDFSLPLLGQTRLRITLKLQLLITK